VLLRFFRINDPYRLLGILVILILVALPLFINPVSIMLDELKMFVLGEILNEGNSLYTEVLTKTPPLFAWISGGFEMLFGRSVTASRMVSLIFIFFQLAFFAIMLINNRAYNENTYLSGLIFGVLALFSFDMLSLSNELIASTLLLFALNNLFKEIEFRIQREEIVLNLGVYLGLASLVVFRYALYLPGVIIILAIFTRLSVRKGLLVIFGFLLPHAFIILLYFWKGNYSSLIKNFYMANLHQSEGAGMTATSMLLLSVVPGMFLLFSFFMLNREARLTKYQSQLSQVMLLWIIISLAVVVISGNVAPHHLITLVPPLSYFISHYILLIRRKRLAEITIWVFITAMVAVLYSTRYEKLKSVNYSDLYPKESAHSAINDKQVLLLGEDWGLLKNNRLAAGFYDWQLTQPIFSELNYFDHVVLIDRAFEDAAPDVIVDKENRMMEVFKRIPRIQALYVREGDLYIKK